MNYRKIPYYGLFAALAILMGYVEFMIPVPVPIPGVKLGLANVIVIIMLYFMDAKSAFFVSLIRVLLSGLLFAGFAGMLYSLAGAEIERENIRTQTMAGREQKAREGKWNGGFAPYGYKLDNGELVIAEDEAEVIRVIYDRYIHTNEGVAGVAKYLNRNGYTKKLRQNNTIPGFSRDFVKNVLYNPVYMGKIAYGRRRTEKKQGTRNEMHVVEQSEFPVYEGQHEAIISEEDWYLAQEKRKINSFKREKVNNSDHAHILSGILKCPCCGKSMYGNIAKAHSKDKKTRYYYYCKNTVTPTGSNG